MDIPATDILAIPPTLLAQITAAADEEHRPAGELIREALERYMEERGRHRLEFLSSLGEAEASLDRGEGIPITPDSMRALADEVKRRGRERLAAERQQQRS